MKNVVLRGPVLTQSGYGVHCRQIAKWLLGRKDLNVSFIVTPWGDTPWYINENECNGLVGEVMKRSLPPTNKKFDISFQLQLPNEWSTDLAIKNVGITAAVETDKCNPDWINACNVMDTVVVPSQHIKKTLTNTGAITKPLLVIPESFSDAIVDSAELQLKLETSFNFLIFGQITGASAESDRKNIFYTIKWLCESFKDNPDVGIVIKTNMGRNTKIDCQVTKNILTKVATEARGTNINPKIYLLHGDMSEKEVAGLYKHNQIKALVSLTRGEGFGLPILEAAASGLPIIATNWSGHLDFLNCGKFIDVNYQLTNIHPSRVDNKIFMKDCKWASPSQEDFKRRITKFYNSHDVPKQWALDLQEKILKNYNFEKVYEAYNTVLSELL